VGFLFSYARPLVLFLPRGPPPHYQLGLPETSAHVVPFSFAQGFSWLIVVGFRRVALIPSTVPFVLASGFELENPSFFFLLKSVLNQVSEA